MTREEAIKGLKVLRKDFSGYKPNEEMFDMAIEALNAQEFDEVVFDMNEFFSIVDAGKITVMRRGRGRVTVEHPAIHMETTICSHGERGEE